MTREEAIAIRVCQLQGGPISANALQEALRVIATTNEPIPEGRFSRARKGTWPRKPRKEAAGAVEE